jgi:protein N-terminal methyltransferase
VVDQCRNYISKAKEILRGSNVCNYYCSGLQDFSFERKYDCIWAQWVLLHLSNEDAAAFLRRAKTHLREDGLIIVKDNVSDRGLVVDREDSSVIRSQELWRELFAQAGLTIIKEEVQPNWPDDMHEVRMYALI